MSRHLNVAERLIKKEYIHQVMARKNSQLLPDHLAQINTMMYALLVDLTYGAERASLRFRGETVVEVFHNKKNNETTFISFSKK